MEEMESFVVKHHEEPTYSMQAPDLIAIDDTFATAKKAIALNAGSQQSGDLDTPNDDFVMSNENESLHNLMPVMEAESSPPAVIPESGKLCPESSIVAAQTLEAVEHHPAPDVPQFTPGSDAADVQSASETGRGQREMPEAPTDEMEPAGDGQEGSQTVLRQPAGDEQEGSQTVLRQPLRFCGEPRLLTTIAAPYGPGNFTKGCKWSPDGTCLLVCSEDARLRLFNLPEPLYGAAASLPAGPPPPAQPEPPTALCSHEGELIYDFTWFPLMRSDNPATCCYASSSRGHPIHLFDAFDGALRCSYRYYNNVDEVSAAYSVAFEPAGERLYAGLDGHLAVFDVSRPGRQIQTRKLREKHSVSSQAGIVSCLAFCPASPDIYAAGSYLRSIGLYDSSDGSQLCLLQGQTGGVTQLHFSPDGTRLYSGGRKDPEVLCWDLRNLGQILYSLQRNVTTNQRMQFDADWTGQHMFSGDSEGYVQIWDTLESPCDLQDTLVLPSIRKFRAHLDCCNGVSAHPWLPVLASCSGQRHLSAALDSSDEESDGRPQTRPENAVKLWWLGS